MKIALLRDLVFRETGMISARALPVILPLKFYPSGDKPESGIIKSSPRLIIRSPDITKKGNIFLPPENPELLSRWFTGSTVPSGGIIETSAGVFIAAAENPEKTSKAEELIKKNMTEAIEWKKNCLEMIHIETAAREKWWTDITWETLWSVRLLAEDNSPVSS